MLEKQQDASQANKTSNLRRLGVSKAIDWESNMDIRWKMTGRDPYKVA
jgi:hypothetical protein